MSYTRFSPCSPCCQDAAPTCEPGPIPDTLQVVIYTGDVGNSCDCFNQVFEIERSGSVWSGTVIGCGGNVIKVEWRYISIEGGICFGVGKLLCNDVVLYDAPVDGDNNFNVIFQSFQVLGESGFALPCCEDSMNISVTIFIVGSGCCPEGLPKTLYLSVPSGCEPLGYPNPLPLTWTEVPVDEWTYSVGDDYVTVSCDGDGWDLTTFIEGVSGMVSAEQDSCSPLNVTFALDSGTYGTCTEANLTE